MLQNAYFLAKIGADTAENEQHFAEILPKTGNYPTGPPGGGAATRRWPQKAPGPDPASVQPVQQPQCVLCFTCKLLKCNFHVFLHELH